MDLFESNGGELITLKEKAHKIKTAYWEANHGITDPSLEALINYILELEKMNEHLEDELDKVYLELERYKRED